MIAGALGIYKGNDFAFLEALGGDVAGALSLWPEGEVPPAPDPKGTPRPLTDDELVDVLRDLARVGVQILTIGQYLRPSESHLPMARYYTPAEFAELKRIALDLGFGHVESGPLVRSSYHAHEQADSLAAAAADRVTNCSREQLIIRSILTSHPGSFEHHRRSDR